MARAGAYRLTPSRRAALRKAQLISARKRKGRRRAAIGVLAGTGVALAGVAAYKRHKMSGSGLYIPSTGTATPVLEFREMKKNGKVKVTTKPVTSSGFSYNSYGKRNFALNLTVRGFGKDYTFLYRHKPLTRYKLLGRKVRNSATEFKPQSAIPDSPVAETYRWANDAPLSEANKNRRNVYGYQNSLARQAYIRKGIGGVEAIRRLRKYENGLKKRGVEYNRPHADMVFKNLLREGV